MKQGVTVVWPERKIDYRVGCVLWRNLDFVQIDGEPLMSPVGRECDVVTMVIVLWMLGAGLKARVPSGSRTSPGESWWVPERGTRG